MTTRREMVQGHILLVQEQRFRLLSDSGQGLLLTLSRKASVHPADLCYFHEANVPVTVEYEGTPNLVSGVALSVKPVRS